MTPEREFEVVTAHLRARVREFGEAAVETAGILKELEAGKISPYSSLKCAIDVSEMPESVRTAEAVTQAYGAKP